VSELGVDFQRDGLLRTPGAVALRVTALDDKPRLVAVEGEAVVEPGFGQLYEVGDGDGGALFSYNSKLNSPFSVATTASGFPAIFLTP